MINKRKREDARTEQVQIRLRKQRTLTNEKGYPCE